MVYIDDCLQRFSTAEVDALIATFPPQRAELLARFSNESARRQGALAYLLLCKALSGDFGISEPPTFVFGEHGKPFLAEHPDVHFNLSHCRVAVACALASSPVGVDIESIRTARPDLVRRTMNDEEARHILSADDPDREFTILWTRKEAVLKLSGRGIVDDMKSVLTSVPSSVRVTTTVRDAYIFSEAEFPYQTLPAGGR